MKIYNYIDKFRCLGDKCEDTCCKGWGMQVDKAHVELYKNEAPELLDAVTSGEAEYIMKRDPKTDYCVKFEDGLCTIHRDMGEKFLGDACHLYPRIIRKFGDETVMSATLSCPEIVRIALYGNDNMFDVIDSDFARMPEQINEYLPEGLSEEGAFSVTRALIDMALDKTSAPERIMAKLVSIAFSLKNHNVSKWSEGINILIKMSDMRLPEPQFNQMNQYYLLQTLSALIYASRKTARPRLEEIFNKMESAIGITIDKKSLEIMQNAGEEDAYDELLMRWKNSSADVEYAPILRRWICSEISMSSFPFGGFGNDVVERAITFAVRFATVRLALMSYMNEDKSPDKSISVFVIESISRFMNHLADPELSMNMYEDAGWTREHRLRSLIGDE